MVFWPPDEKATLQELIEHADQAHVRGEARKRDAAVG